MQCPTRDLLENGACMEDVEHTRMHDLVKINDHGGALLCLCECSLVEPVINMWDLKTRRIKMGIIIIYHGEAYVTFLEDGGGGGSMHLIFIQMYVVQKIRKGRVASRLLIYIILAYSPFGIPNPKYGCHHNQAKAESINSLFFY